MTNECGVSKGFRESVRSVVVGVDAAQPDLLLFDAIPDVMVSYIDVLGA
jgi:hypothetical protein